MKEKTATFIGHGDCSGVDENAVRSAVISLIDKGVTEFINGGMGGFDWLTARVVYELKKDYPHIKNLLVIPYLNFTIRSRELFDEIIFPEGFEKCHFKAAIPKRNRYLIDHSAYAVCFIRHTVGGAYKTYMLAKKQGLEILEV